MRARNEVTAKIIGKDLTYLKFNSGGVYEFKENKQQSLRKIYSASHRLTFRIIDIKVQPDLQYHFVVKINERSHSLEIVVEGQKDLENLWKITNNNSVVMGLKDMLASFRKVGEGAFAQVFEAHTKYQTKIALKSFQKKMLHAEEKNFDIFDNEIELLKKLSSRYIVSYDYLFETERAFYLKMQYFPFTLRSKLKSRKIMPQDQKIIMKQLLQALIELKSKGIVHRDIKPANIMIRVDEKTGDEQCVLIDFGLATQQQATPYLLVRCGTPGYMSPEVSNAANNEVKITCASDMFSLGCVFYKMVAGKSLFAAKSPQAILKLNKKCKYRSSSFQKLSMEEYCLLSAMLQPDPTKRITPQAALQHSYFDNNVDDFDEIPDEECSVDEKLKRILPIYQIKNMGAVCQSGDSVVISTQERVRVRKDTAGSSFLTFDLVSRSHESSSELNKENISKLEGRKPKRKTSRFSQQKNILSQI